MAKSIITENDEILIFENIISIHVITKEKYYSHKDDAYIVCAETVNRSDDT